MNLGNSKFDRQRLIKEIQGLGREPAIDAWNKIKNGFDYKSGADDLGFPIEYFRNLVSQEFVNKLNDGLSFTEFPRFDSSMEDRCWKTVSALAKSGLPANIDTPLCIQLRCKLLHLYKEGVSLQETSQKFELQETLIKSLVMLALVEDGSTLDEISIEFRLTRERVRQMIKKLGISIRAIRQKQSTEVGSDKAELKESIESWILAHPGCYLSEITEEFKIIEGLVKTLCPQTLKKLVIGGKPTRDAQNYTKFSQEQILSAIRKAYELRNPSMSMYSVNETQPLTGPFYEVLRKKGTVYGPSQMRVLQIFGTWKVACQEAGVPSVEAVRDVYELRWTDEELIEQLAEFISTTELHSVDRFDEWCRLNDSRSSSGTIRNQIGPWSESYELALLHLRRQWTNK